MRILSPEKVKQNFKQAVGEEEFQAWEALNEQFPNSIDSIMSFLDQTYTPVMVNIALANGCQRADLVRTSVDRFFAGMRRAYEEYQDITIFDKPNAPLNEAQDAALREVAYTVYEWRYMKNCGFLLDGVFVCFCDEATE